MGKIRRNLTIFLIFFSICRIEILGQELQNAILATVNGEPVTLFDTVLECAREEARLPMVYSGKDLQVEIEKLRKKTIIDIIGRKLLYEEFKEKGYTLPKQCVEEMLDNLAADIGGGSREVLEKKALASGMTMDNLREMALEKIAVKALVDELCYKKAYITPKEINDYYRDNIKEFSRPPRVELQILLLKKDGLYEENLADFVKKLEEEIKVADEGVFSKLVKLYSEGPNISEGGNVGWIEEDKLRPDFAQALKGLKAGDIAGPVKAEEGLYFFRLAGRIQERTEPLAAVKDKIQDSLLQKEKEKYYSEYIQRLKDKAVIRYFF